MISTFCVLVKKVLPNLSYEDIPLKFSMKALLPSSLPSFNPPSSLLPSLSFFLSPSFSLFSSLPPFFPLCLFVYFCIVWCKYENILLSRWLSKWSSTFLNIEKTIHSSYALYFPVALLVSFSIHRQITQS